MSACACIISSCKAGDELDQHVVTPTGCGPPLCLNSLHKRQIGWSDGAVGTLPLGVASWLGALSASRCQASAFSDSSPQVAMPRFAILEMEDAEKWEGYTEKLWRHALEEPGDSWELFKCCQGHFPTIQQATAFDCLLLSGGHYSAYEHEPWIQQLRALLPQYADAGVKMFGCCFGCQILAHSLGGRVGPNPSGRFVLTVERIRLLPGLHQYPALAAAMQEAFAQASSAAHAAAAHLSGAPESMDEPAASCAAAPEDAYAVTVALDDAWYSNSVAATEAVAAATASGTGGAAAEACTNLASEPSQSCEDTEPCLRLLESHGDQVLELPPGATALATSDTAQYELWAMGTNILACQFHVEFDCALAQEKIWERLSSSGRLSAEEAAASLAALNGRAPDAAAMVAVIQTFMRQGIATDASRTAARADASASSNVDGGALEHGSDPLDQLNTLPVQPPQQSGPSTVIQLSQLLHHTAGSTSSPSAMSEVSGSVAALPFVYLAKQRQQAEREVSLMALTHQTVNDTSAAIDAQMEAYSCDYQLLAQLNAAADAEAGTCSDVSAALGQFAVDLEVRQASLHEVLSGALPAIDAQLQGLEAVVLQLDNRSEALEKHLLEEAAKAAAARANSASNGGMGSNSYMSSLYQTLQRLPRMGSSSGPNQQVAQAPF